MYEKLTKNSEFNNGFTDWNAGASWSVVSGKAVWQGWTTGGSATLYQDIPSLVEGQTYEVWFSLSGIVWQGSPPGYVEVSLAGQNAPTTYSSEGNYRVQITAGSLTKRVKFVVFPTDAANSENQDKLELDNVFVVYEKDLAQQFPHKSFSAADEEITKIVNTSEYQGSPT